MRQIQNISALIFFILIHVPLCRLSPYFSLLTSLIPLILDKKNKQRIYLWAYKFVALATFDRSSSPPEILSKKSHLADKFKKLKYLELRECQSASINLTVFYIGLFFSILFNYLYTVYLGRLVEILSEVVIRSFDKVGFEIHFIRLVYFAIFDQST